MKGTESEQRWVCREILLLMQSLRVRFYGSTRRRETDQVESEIESESDEVSPGDPWKSS